MDQSIAIALVAWVLFFYLLPPIIGFKRGVSNRWLLLWLNLAIGWTIIGWIVCLIWAVSGATKAQDAYYRRVA